MKPIILLACLFICSCSLLANDTLIFRIRDPRLGAKDPTGSYLRKVISTADSGLLVLDYNQTGLVAKGYYADTNFETKLYSHAFYKPGKDFPFEIKCYDDDGNMSLHAELNNSGDTIWRQTLQNDAPINSKLFTEHEADRTIFFSMQKPAIFRGGSANWKKFIAANLKYPKEAAAKKTEGTVLVEFNVSKEGKVFQPKVVQSAGPLLDAEAVRLITNSPNWIPAEVNGNKVNFKQRQSVIFKL